MSKLSSSPSSDRNDASKQPEVSLDAKLAEGTHEAPLSESERRVMEVLNITPRDEADAVRLYKEMLLEGEFARGAADIARDAHRALRDNGITELDDTPVTGVLVSMDAMREQRDATLRATGRISGQNTIPWSQAQEKLAA